jgi:CheY-like chemotaxis protein
VADQLAALDAWHRVRRAAEQAEQAPQASREQRLDAARRHEARQREHDALLARAQEQLRDTSASLGSDQPRAVVAHRSDWFRGKVAARLHEQGVAVVGSVGDGAAAVAAVVLDQPDLLLVEELMPHLPAGEVLVRARQLAPLTVVGAQVQSPQAAPALLEAGARAVFSRRIPPAEVADALVTFLRGGTETVQLL